MDVIIDLRDSLKLANGTEAGQKLDGLRGLDRILALNDPKLVEYGYDKVLLKELLKFIKFEEDEILRTTLEIIHKHYAPRGEFQDEIMEDLLYRYGLTTNTEISQVCLDNISLTIDHMGDNIAKHSKQLLQLADITVTSSMNTKVEEILLKMKTKLPKRRTDLST